MFKISATEPNRLEIEMSGRLNTAEMRAALDDLVSKSETIEHGTMLYDVTDFHLPTLVPIGVEISRLFTLLRFMKKYRRAAVLTDKEWLQKVSELEGLFYPGLKIKAFSRDQRQAAEAGQSG